MAIASGLIDRGWLSDPSNSSAYRRRCLPLPGDDLLG
jgi:hypothetical protein